jgi:hypothetical protein
LKGTRQRKKFDFKQKLLRGSRGQFSRKEPPGRRRQKSFFRVLIRVQDGQAKSSIIFFRFSAHPVDKNMVQ